MSALNKVNVVIGGEIITLISNENEEYMQKLARYIDIKLTEIKSMKSNASINERTRTLFFAVNVADDYFKTLEKLRFLEGEHEKYILELGRMQEENYLLTEKIHEMQDRLNTDPPRPNPPSKGRNDVPSGEPVQGKRFQVIS